MKTPKPITKKRSKPRRGPLRDAGYLKFLREQGFCVICWQGISIHTLDDGILCRGKGIDPSHGPVNGTSSKGPDSGAIPLCRSHHELQHKVGWPEFEHYFSFSRKAKAAEWWQAYQQSKESNKRK